MFYTFAGEGSGTTIKWPSLITSLSQGGAAKETLEMRFDLTGARVARILGLLLPAAQAKPVQAFMVFMMHGKASVAKSDFALE